MIHNRIIQLPNYICLTNEKKFPIINDKILSIYLNINGIPIYKYRIATHQLFLLHHKLHLR